MKFHEFKGYGKEICRLMADGAALNAKGKGDKLESQAGAASLEHVWRSNGCPYYNIWPAIIPMMEDISIDVPGDSIFFPSLPRETIVLKSDEGYYEGEVQSLLLRFPLGGGLPFNTSLITVFRRADTIMFHIFSENGTAYNVANWNGGRGELISATECTNDRVRKIIQVVCCIALIQDDPDLINREILNRDMAKYSIADYIRKRELEDKAKRRGKYGWNVGMQIESCPHLRKSHLCLFHTGKGRTRPVIKLRKGAVVKRKKIAAVPTGFQEST